MITISTTSPGEARAVAALLQKVPAWLDYRVYLMGTQVAASATGRARQVSGENWPDTEEKR